MRRLNRYISGSVLFFTLAALVVLAGLDLVSLIISETRNVEGDYTFARVLSYVAWMTPSTAFEYLTYASFLGCVIGLGVHANANELVILRAAGVGMSKIVWAVLRPVLLLTAIGFFWGEYITPITVQQAEGVRALALRERGALQPNQGQWYLESNTNTFMHFSGVNRQLYGITQYHMDGERKRLVASSFAREALFQDGNWTLEGLRESRLVGGDDGRPLQEAHFEQREENSENWDTDLSPELLNDMMLPADALPATRLYRNAKTQDKQGLASNVYWLSFWQKVAQPLVIISLTLVGISFVFGSMREATMGLRLTIAVLVGIVFKILQDFLGTSSLVFEFSPIIAVFVPVGLCCLVGAWMLRRS